MSMKHLLFLFYSLMASIPMLANDVTNIRISTDATDLILQVAPNHRIYQVYLGSKLSTTTDLSLFRWNCYASSDASVNTRGHEVYTASGGEDYFEPALGITHADGNMTTYLYYKNFEQHAVDGGTETTIQLADNKYALNVTLHYVAYAKENVIKTWSEISHHEKGPINLWQYGSAMLYFKNRSYYLTNYHSDWAREGQPTTQQLQAGKKVIDTKLGSRAAMQMEPFFELGLDQPPHEQQGHVLLGTIGWTGNFRCTFEVDNVGVLRVIPGINPYAANYRLISGQTFKTPDFIFTMSEQGTGIASRQLHNWARHYQLKDGLGPRLTLLNNWESTGFNFNQNSLSALMKDAKVLGVDMFLLDDGWFGNKYPRKDDQAGLGDWEPTHQKLPGGLKALVDSAKQAGVKFGLWIEPEMVNPKSELYEKHPNWVIEQPNRDTYYYRHQLVLDLSNPQVQDYVFGVIDRLLSENPGIAYFKWDCNSPITNIYSPYNKDHQGNMYTDHVRGLYNVIKRVNAKYPQLPMMLCSGGGARCDYEALKYFTEFWCSDDTDPFERLYIQWSLSKFFPTKAMAAHVTNWNKRTTIKFRTDVASMCKLGFDLNLKTLSPTELSFTQQAVANYNRLKATILDGTQYRLLSPYETEHMAVNYVSNDGRKVVLFAYNLHPRYKEVPTNVCLQGLDPNAIYMVTETNLMPGTESKATCHGHQFSGDYLMKVGLDILSDQSGTSHVFELSR